MLEAKAKDQEHKGASVLQKKRSSRKKTQTFRKISGKKIKGHGFSPFLATKKIVLSSTEDRAFSRTYRLRGLGQGLYLRGRELQDVSSRTPPLRNMDTKTG